MNMNRCVHGKSNSISDILFAFRFLFLSFKLRLEILEIVMEMQFDKWCLCDGISQDLNEFSLKTLFAKCFLSWIEFLALLWLQWIAITVFHVSENFTVDYKFQIKLAVWCFLLNSQYEKLLKVSHLNVQSISINSFIWKLVYMTFNVFSLVKLCKIFISNFQSLSLKNHFGKLWKAFCVSFSMVRNL